MSTQFPGVELLDHLALLGAEVVSSGFSCEMAAMAQIVDGPDLAVNHRLGSRWLRRRFNDSWLRYFRSRG